MTTRQALSENFFKGFHNMALLCVFLLFHLSRFVTSEPQFVSAFCQNKSGVYTSNSLYQNNLSLIFFNATAAAAVRGFYNTTAGEGLDKVYALFYCRGDLKSQDCHTCVQTASSRIISECSSEKEAIVFFEECTLRYANRLIFSLEEEDPNDWSYSDTLVSDKDQFSQILTTAMEVPMNQAAFNSSLQGYATGMTDFSVNQTLYCLVQCTPDILGTLCHKCLVAALDNLVDEGKTRMGLFMPSCEVMYSLNRFFSTGNAPIPSSFSPISKNPPGEPSSQVPQTQKKGQLSFAVVVIVPVATVGLVLFLFALWFCRRRKKADEECKDKHSKGQAEQWMYNVPEIVQLSPQKGSFEPMPPATSSSISSEKSHLPQSSGLQLPIQRTTFTCTELALATSNFSSVNIIGQGGFGFVYKGVLPNNTEIAVKQLKTGSSQGEREFQAEVETIDRIHHRHLVSFIGYCIADAERMLVYEFIPNKTLQIHLHGEGRPPMSWATRLRIALGAAKGLTYLHEGCEPLVMQALEGGSYDGLIDPRLESCNSSEIGIMVGCAAVCTRSSGRQRPQMSQVVRALEGSLSVKDLVKEIACSSDFDSGDQYKEDFKKLRMLALNSQDHSTSEGSVFFTSDHDALQSTSTAENNHDSQRIEDEKPNRELEIYLDSPEMNRMQIDLQKLSLCAPMNIR